MTKIYLIRHAEAEGNIFRRAHGHANGFIIGRGFAQIEQLKDRFTDEKIDAVYSSDLTRAITTAAAIAEPHGLEINTTEALREINMGVWEDYAWGDMEYFDPEMGRNFTFDPANWKVEGSETFEQVVNRMETCIKEIAKKHDGGSVAVFSHGFAIRAFMCRILGIESNESGKLPYFDNTAVTLLVFDDGKISIEYQGDNSHLKSETSTFANQTWWRSEKEQVMENARFMPYDAVRDKNLTGMCESSAEVITYTAFLWDEPVGFVGFEADRDCWTDEPNPPDSELSAKAGESEGDSGKSTVWLRSIFVLPARRRTGIGVQLLGQVVSHLRKMRWNTLSVEAAEGSALASFCMKFGFVKTGENNRLDILVKNIKNW